MARYRNAVIPGDGIGKETVPEGIRVLDAVGSRFGIDFEWDHFDWSCERYANTGAMMPPDGLDAISGHDAIFLGAVGFPGVADHIPLWGLLIPVRRQFQQYVNLRPVRLLNGVESPLKGRTADDIDFGVVRENNEGEYSEIGGRMFAGTDDEMVMQESVFTRRGTDRIMRYAFELARKRAAKHVTSATKSNGITYTMPFWDERFEAVAADYPDIETAKFHVDILAAQFVLHPDWFDVVVGSNLFGDILSDLGPAVAGTIGIPKALRISCASSTSANDGLLQLGRGDHARDKRIYLGHRVGKMLRPSAEGDNRLVRGKWHGAKFGSTHLRVAVDGPEPCIQKAAVVERRKTPGLVLGERAAGPVDVVEMILQPDLRDCKVRGYVRRCRQPARLFLSAETAYENVVPIGNQQRLGTRA